MLNQPKLKWAIPPAVLGMLVSVICEKKPDTVVEHQPYGSKTIHIMNIWVQQWGRHPQPLVFLLQISGTHHSCSAALFMDLEVLVGDTFTRRYHWHFHQICLFAWGNVSSEMQVLWAQTDWHASGSRRSDWDFRPRKNGPQLGSTTGFFFPPSYCIAHNVQTVEEVVVSQAICDDLHGPHKIWPWPLSP